MLISEAYGHFSQDNYLLADSIRTKTCEGGMYKFVKSASSVSHTFSIIRSYFINSLQLFNDY